MSEHEIELFLDRHRISWEYNVRRQVNRPVRHAGNPILRSEYPWEELYVTMYGNVLPKEDGSGYRMWYVGGAKGMQKGQYLCYAESDDGLSWQRVMSDRNPFGKTRGTNILTGLKHNVHGPHVLHNRHSSDPAERYLMFYDSYPGSRPELDRVLQGSRWCYTMTSPDGRAWSPEEGRPAVPGKSDSGNSVVWDPARERYIAYMRGMRPHSELRPSDGPHGETVRVRYVRAAVSRDFLHWSDPVELWRAGSDEGDPHHHIHQLAVTRRGSQFVGLRSMFQVEEYARITYEGRENFLMEDGVCESQLAVSRDGLNWSRVADGQVFLARGDPSAWDHRWIVTPGEFLVEKDRMLFYYGASNKRRADAPMNLAIGVSELPRDRFQALRPSQPHQPAVIETKPLYIGTGDLVLNADASHGAIEAELVTFHGLPVEGFTRRDCAHAEGDSLDHVIRWKGGRLSDAITPESLFHRAVRIRLYLHNASLYAMYLPHCVDPIAV